MSGDADERLTELGVSDSGAGFLQKPFHLRKLGLKVREALGEGV